jgi:putative phage-type endonuclease
MSFIIERPDFRETISILVHECMFLNIKHCIFPNFNSIIVKDVRELLELTFINTSILSNVDNLNEIIEEIIALFYISISPPRSSGNTFIRITPNMNKIKEKIEYLQNIPQPEQRTTEWYEFRNKHLTASNIWKTFISESSKNQLIFEKCNPLNLSKYSSHVSLDTPMHWGQKYEPLSLMLYESIYNTKVSEFGCIPHKTIHFLAASPDGINTCETSLRYGRMLEIKNIVNREINGIPKMEYWVQMQLQMEVCNLNECDFLETRFNEYDNFTEFENDNLTEYKGIIMLFMNENGQPKYEYAPLILSDTQEWEEENMEKYKHLTWIKNIYWKLDQLSCVLVLRNKLWFSSALNELKDIWNIIEYEKNTGDYILRGPKKMTQSRQKKRGVDDDNNIKMPSTCFITINHD